MVMMSMGAGAAQAGEITGNGTRVFPVHQLPGNSACAYSGQNDEFQEGDSSAPRVQSFGQFARYAGGAIGGVPGFECNPTRATGE
jgi:hypothetical protein